MRLSAEDTIDVLTAEDKMSNEERVLQQTAESLVSATFGGKSTADFSDHDWQLVEAHKRRLQVAEPQPRATFKLDTRDRNGGENG